MKILTFLVVLCGWQLLQGQTPYLERKITISLHDEPLEASLTKISAAAGFVFSYNPAILDLRKTITKDFVNRSVREILHDIFDGTVQYKARGKYIILTAAPEASARAEPAIVTGYVVDESTGERLKDVSIYDPVTLSSTITDSYGYFEIKIDRPADEIILSVNRQNYTDTLVAVANKKRLLNIPIRNKDKIAVLADSVNQKLKRFWNKHKLWFDNINIRNIDDTLYRTSQVSLVPYVGSNHKMSGHVINDYSLNIIGGASLGVRRMEFGGLFNLVRGDVKGAQFAGFFNGVGGTLNGVQFAGGINGNLGGAEGAQFAGIMNINRKEVSGFLTAGVANISTGQTSAAQIAGVFNVSGNGSSPIQLAGVYNITAGEMKGMQTAGVFNVTAKDHKGVQFAGVFNIAGKEIRGAQIAGVINIARRVKGVQIGLFNFADSVRGIPIGLMSIVGKGYHKIEVSADEIFYNNLAFRTGVHQFYNIFTAGAKPASYSEDETIWTFGYGVGTAPRLSRRFYLNFDITSNQIVQGNRIEAINLLNKLYVGFEYQIFKKLSFTMGATVNGYVTENSFDTYPEVFTHYQPDIFLDRDFGSDYNLKMWMGAKVGLRFF